MRQQVTVPAEFGSAPAHHPYHQTTISGPSFLGLTDSADDRADYLLEDEHPRHSHTGWVVFSLIAIVLLAGVGWLEWKAIKTGQIELPWLKTAAASPAPAQPAENASAPPATTESATKASDQTNASDEKLPAENGNNGGSTTSSSGSDAMLAAADSKGDTTTPGTNAPDGTSDSDATHAAQTRIATDAAQRRAQADAEKSPAKTDDNSAVAPEKPAPKTAAVKATAPKPPDPRQDRMLIAGEKYLYGRGVPQDCNQALVYFRAAAEKQNAPAMSHLGAMYASGHCVTQNKVAAYKWFSMASNSEPNNEWISRSLNMLWRDMSPQERASVAR